MKHALLGLAFVLTWMVPVGADEEVIRWLIDYQADALPGSDWTVVGSPNATIEDGALQLIDAGADFGYYRREWESQPNEEIVVEARVKVNSVTGSQSNKPATSLWPWRDGAPVMLQVCDGRRQEGLVLFPTQATSFTDRFIPMDTCDAFHTYRLVISGSDMEMFVDGVRQVVGQNAFWKPAVSRPFLQFGSSAKVATGDARWDYVKLGVREPRSKPEPPPVKITIGEPWNIPRDDVRQTRPYLYDLGNKLLLMSVAQGPDALYEPYGLLKSVDAGRTWRPIPGLDQLDTTPLPVLRRPDGTILAASRWTWLQPDGSILGKTVRFDADRRELHDERQPDQLADRIRQ